MSAGEPPGIAPRPVDIVAGRIRDRYSTPARKAYTYLFRLKPGTSFDELVPAVDAILDAWVDEGGGLEPVPPDIAVQRCRAAQQIKPHEWSPAQLTPHQRRQMMARAILFTVGQPDDERVEVHLISRAVGFSPKGDREAHEEWRRAAGDFWYSTRRPEA